jgi:hypothetical protein
MLLYANAGERLRRLVETVKQCSSATNVICVTARVALLLLARRRWRLWLLAVPRERRRSDRCACGEADRGHGGQTLELHILFLRRRSRML